MIKQILLITCVMFLVTGCNLELKRSANNKLFDTKGFDGGKRRPVYNNKYIDRAKRNIVDNNYDEPDANIDELDEYVDPYTQNRIMYSNMIKKEKAKKGNRKKPGQNPYDQPWPDIGHAKDIALSRGTGTQSDQDLRTELAEIKTMLSAAKKDLVKYKCPLQESPANVKPNLVPQVKKQAQLIPKPKKPLLNAPEPDEVNYEDPLAGNDMPSGNAAVAAETVAPAPQVVQSGPVAPKPPLHDDEIVDELPQSRQNSIPAAPAPSASAGHSMINLAPVK